MIAAASAAGYLAGVPLARWYPELEDCFLVAVTENRTREEIDGLAECLARSTAVRHAWGVGSWRARVVTGFFPSLLMALSWLQWLANESRERTATQGVRIHGHERRHKEPR